MRTPRQDRNVRGLLYPIEALETKCTMAVVTYSELQTVLREYLADWRKGMNLSQRKFAGGAGLHHGDISDAVNGEREVRLEWLLKLSVAYGRPAHLMFAEIGKRCAEFEVRQITDQPIARVTTEKGGLAVRAEHRELIEATIEGEKARKRKRGAKESEQPKPQHESKSDHPSRRSRTLPPR
jgi:transcriptional regulator with XRE-family HTH domain